MWLFKQNILKTRRIDNSSLVIVLIEVSEGCADFTTSGTPMSAIIVQSSTDNGATWADDTGSFNSPRCGLLIPTVDTLYRMKSIDAVPIYSNVIKVVIKVVSNFSIASSVPTSTGGTLDIIGGQPFETIQITATLTFYDSSAFQYLSFANPASIASLESLHTVRSGSIVLDSAGKAKSIYSYGTSGAAFNANVKITSRSSGLAMPNTTTTYISNS